MHLLRRRKQVTIRNRKLSAAKATKREMNRMEMVRRRLHRRREREMTMMERFLTRQLAVTELEAWASAHTSSMQMI